MDKKMHVTVSQIDKAIFDGDAVSVTVPGVEGELTILPRHEAFITPLKAGHITVRVGEADSAPSVFEVTQGICEVSRNQVTILL